MGHQKQVSSIREPYLGRVEPGADIERVGSSIWAPETGFLNQRALPWQGSARGADIEGWFLNMGHQKQGSSIRAPYLARDQPGADIKGWFLNKGHQKQTGFLKQRALP
jgi:hypothetical protein